ncbi:MAG: hypothetical protein HQM08_25595 [Candidatus Riflebacteria bacterium]|nr:hypothetical protein [Candidatus Riflebacteria bacterium]
MEQEKAYRIPEAVNREISLFFSESEKIIGAIPSASGPIGKIGELWMILTDLNLFFYTREYGNNPVVAMMPKKDVKMIVYTPSPAGVTLTINHKTQPLSAVRIPFPKSQTAGVNSFCEELAKDIPVELGSKEDPGKDAPEKKGEFPQIPKSLKSNVFSPSLNLANQANKEELKEKTFPEPRISLEINRAPEIVKIKPPVVGNDLPKVKPVVTSEKIVTEAESPFWFSLAAIFFSIIVGFLWYSFFCDSNRNGK